MIRKLNLAFVIGLTAIPIAVQAQGVVGGAEQGSANGASEAGPVGAIVGGTVGAVTGGVASVLGLDQRPRFREYVSSQERPSFAYTNQLRVGDVLAPAGLNYYAVPPGYGAA